MNVSYYKMTNKVCDGLWLNYFASKSGADEQVSHIHVMNDSKAHAKPKSSSDFDVNIVKNIFRQIPADIRLKATGFCLLVIYFNIFHQ